MSCWASALFSFVETFQATTNRLNRSSTTYNDNIDSGMSWRSRSQIDNNISSEIINKIFNYAWHFFKHGDRDPDGILSVDSLDTEYLLFLTTLDAGDLGVRTKSMEVFQAWFVCEYPQHFIQNFSFRDTAQRFFKSSDWGDEVSSIEKAMELLNGYVKNQRNDQVRSELMALLSRKHSALFYVT